MDILLQVCSLAYIGSLLMVLKPRIHELKLKNLNCKWVEREQLQELRRSSAGLRDCENPPHEMMCKHHQN
jgi:hypothetical protein